MMIQLLQPTGPELARRCLAALTLVPAEKRESVVVAVERQIAEEFTGEQPERTSEDRTSPSGPPASG
ncbi:MAG: hypothetical protein AAGF47_01660 [Planctomycetota bacterium]